MAVINFLTSSYSRLPKASRLLQKTAKVPPLSPAADESVSAMKKNNTKPTLTKFLNFAESAYDHTNIQTEYLFADMNDAVQNDDFLISQDNLDSINSIKYHGMISDCADYLKEIIINSKEAKILEFSLTNQPRDIESLNNYLQTRLNNYNLKGSSYVYMAWKNRPEEYYYVGQGKTGARINLSSHGKLLESLKHATYFTMLFPVSAKKDIISNLEAAVINLIESLVSGKTKNGHFHMCKCMILLGQECSMCFKSVTLVKYDLHCVLRGKIDYATIFTGH